MPRVPFELSEQEKQFIKSADFEDARFGFELETQAFLGCTMTNVSDIVTEFRSQSTLGEKEIAELIEQKLEQSKDDPALVKRFLDRCFFSGNLIEDAYNLTQRTTYDNADCLILYMTVRALYRKHGLRLAYLNGDGLDGLNRVFQEGRTVTLQDILAEEGREGGRDIIVSAFKNHIRRTLSSSEMRKIPEQMKPYFVSWDMESFYPTLAGKNWHPDLECVSDGSVSGPEIKPKRPLSFTEAESALDVLFKNEMVVDTRCSFHVHVSINGNHARYDEKIQMYMIEFLVANIHNVPASCRARWMNRYQVARYFAILPSADKYSFIHFHRRFKTWEFRCFGNITNSADAISCLKLAAGAYKYALKRRAKEEKGILQKTTGTRKSFLFLKQTLDAFLQDESVDVKKQFKQVDREYKQKNPGNRFSIRELQNIYSIERSEPSVLNSSHFHQNYADAIENVKRIRSVS